MRSMASASTLSSNLSCCTLSFLYSRKSEMLAFLSFSTSRRFTVRVEALSLTYTVLFAIWRNLLTCEAEVYPLRRLCVCRVSVVEGVTGVKQTNSNNCGGQRGSAKSNRTVPFGTARGKEALTL